MIVKIYIGNDQVELQKDESISITSSVLSIQDITKNTTDYSRAFTVPASEENNKLFKHYYDANIDNTFDARIKVDGRIEIDGVRFRVGKFLLQKVNVKQGKPTSYTINFFGNLVSLKDLLGNNELSQLNFTELDHSYNSVNVKNGLTDSLFNGKIIYNLLVKKQLYYSGLLTDTTQTEKSVNIAYNNPTSLNGVRYSELKPSIKLLSIIEAIEVDNGIVFSRDFFGRSEFTNLYLWLNNETSMGAGGGNQIINWNDGSGSYIDFISDIGLYSSSNNYNGNEVEDWVLEVTVTPENDYITIIYTINVYVNGIVVGKKTITPAGGVLTPGKLEITLESNFGEFDDYEVYWEVETSSDFQYTASVSQGRYVSIPPNETTQIFITTASVDNISTVGGISKNMPKIKIIDFLKGLFHTFKLVVIPQKDGTIYINTLKDYYAQGRLFNITEYIDFENIDIERGNILNTISYKFQDPTTILNKQFKENNRIAYGDEEAILKDDNGVVLDGETSTIEVPFEQFIYDRLIDQNDATTTNIMYGAIVDEKVEPANPSPHIFYNIKQEIGEKSFGFLQENDVKLEIRDQINMPCHTDTILNQTFSTTFSQEYNEWNGVLIKNTIYSNYHQAYINNIFNIKRRNFTFTSKILPLSILVNLDLNDIVQIKENYYRIDKFTTDIITGKTEFNLVNAFDFTLNSFSTQSENILLDYKAQSYSAYVTNLTNYTVTKVDNGDGIDWLTITDDGAGNLILTVTENEIGFSRDIFINLVKNDTLQEINIYLTQGPGIQKGVLDFSNNLNGVYQTLLLTGKM